VQILGESHGNVVHLFERNCTMKRRNPKLIEGTVRRCARAVGYQNAGTVEIEPA